MSAGPLVGSQGHRQRATRRFWPVHCQQYQEQSHGSLLCTQLSISDWQQLRNGSSAGCGRHLSGNITSWPWLKMKTSCFQQLAVPAQFMLAPTSPGGVCSRLHFVASRALLYRSSHHAACLSVKGTSMHPSHAFQTHVLRAILLLTLLVLGSGQLQDEPCR